MAKGEPLDKKLKTLKDMIYNYRSANLVHASDLREEAIKWVKKLDEEGGKCRGWFMKFFNLTEEDLK